MSKHQVTSVRLPSELIKALKSRNIKLNNLITVLLAKYLDLQKCPTCGQHLKDDK